MKTAIIAVLIALSWGCMGGIVFIGMMLSRLQ